MAPSKPTSKPDIAMNTGVTNFLNFHLDWCGQKIEEK